VTEHVFREDDLVDIVIRGAEVVLHAADELTFTLRGRHLNIDAVPLVDDDGRRLASVTVTATPPVVRPGDLWRSVNRGFLFFGYEHAGVAYLMMADGQPHSAEDAVRLYGELERIVDGRLASTVRDQDPMVAAAAAAATPLYDSLPAHPSHPGAWDAFSMPDRPAAEASPVEPDQDATAVLPAVPPERQAATT
jgi:hypothetical protein